jgi:hypothetical protein
LHQEIQSPLILGRAIAALKGPNLLNGFDIPFEFLNTPSGQQRSPLDKKVHRVGESLVLEYRVILYVEILKRDALRVELLAEAVRVLEIHTVHVILHVLEPHDLQLKLFHIQRESVLGELALIHGLIAIGHVEKASE